MTGQFSLQEFLQALSLSLGYNATIVGLGTAILGAAAGMVGTFVLMRGRAMVSDAISHAALPGICLAFIAAEIFAGNGRWLPVLLLGAASTALFGLAAINWIANHTLLKEDAAIGTVLSTFFAIGVVLLTIIQSLDASGQAGLEGFLLGAAAGMIRSEAILIGVMALLVCGSVIAVRKELTLLCFDREFASASGFNIPLLDRLLLLLLLVVVVIGLKSVGLILIIALTIIPPVTARFWSRRLGPMAGMSAIIGAVGCHVGAALSASAPDLPAGALIVLTLFAFCLLSIVISPFRGIVAQAAARYRFRQIVHLRQGLLSLAHDEPALEPLTRRILKQRKYIDAAGQITRSGREAARQMARDQALWNRFRFEYPAESFQLADWSLRPIEECLPPDMVAHLNRKISQQPKY